MWGVWDVASELRGECGIWGVSMRSGMWDVVWRAGYSD